MNTYTYTVHKGLKLVYATGEVKAADTLQAMAKIAAYYGNPAPDAVILDVGDSFSISVKLKPA